MRKIVFALSVLAFLAVGLPAETSYDGVSASQTVSYVYFNTQRAAVTICNSSGSGNTVYFRLFNRNDTVAAATTSSSPLIVGCLLYTSDAADE